jgi:glycine cleavage system H protein
LADYDIPDDLGFSEHDEWVRRDGDRAVVGITDYAQDQLGDIVFVEFPAVGTAVTRGEAFGEIESVKAVSALYAPVSGVVARINEALEDTPEKVNEDCYGAGWLIEIGDPVADHLDSLLDAAAYRRHVEERSE